MSDEDVASRALSATRSNLVAFPLIGACTFAAGVVVARALPVADFAVYALALALRGTVQLLADFGTGAASARAFAQLEAAGQRASALRLYARLGAARCIASTLFAAAVVLGSDAATGYLGLGPDDREALVWVVVMSAAEIVGGLGTYVLVGTLRHGWLNRALLGYSLLQPALVVAAATAGLGLSGVLAALAAASVGKAAFLHVSATRALRRVATHGQEASGLARSLARTAGAVSIGKLAAWAHSRPALSFVMMPAAGRPEFAVFALGYDLAHQVMSLVSAPAGNVIPAVAAKTAQNQERLRRISSPVVVFLLTASAGVALVLAVTMAVVDGVIYGSHYSELGRYVAILLPAIVVEIAVATPATAILVADDRLLRRLAAIRVVELALLPCYLIVGFEHLVAVTAVMAAIRCATAVALLVAAEHAIGSLLPRGWASRFLLAAALAAIAGVGGLTLPVADVVRGAGGGALAAGAFVILTRRLRLLGDAELRLAQRLLPAAAPLLAWFRPRAHAS